MPPLLDLVPARLREHEALVQFVRYAVVGCLNVVVYFAVFNAGLRTNLSHPSAEPSKLHTVVASAVAFFGTSVMSFVLNKLWAFRDHRRERVVRQYGLFLFFTLVGLGLNSGALFVLLVPFHRFGTLGRNIAALCALPVSIVWNFTAYRRWTFSSSPAPARASSA